MFDSIPLILAVDDAAAPAIEAPPELPPDLPADTATGGGNATQQQGPPGGEASKQNTQSPGGGMGMIYMLLLVFVVFMLFTTWTQRKEKKKRVQMLSAMTKGAKVQTIGGIIGTVVEVRDNEVVVKVDENANTRIKFARSAIQTVLADKES